MKPGELSVDGYNIPMNEQSNTSTQAWFETYLHRELPISRAMQVVVTEVSEHQVRLSAPLDPNRNDKQTGFGGSLASLLFMAGWGWLFNTLKRLQIEADVVVMDSAISYRRPTTGELQASCQAPANAELEKFLQRLNQRGVARLGLKSWIGHQDDPNVMMEGRFVAKMERKL